MFYCKHFILCREEFLGILLLRVMLIAPSFLIVVEPLNILLYRYLLLLIALNCLIEKFLLLLLYLCFVIFLVNLMILYANITTKARPRVLSSVLTKQGGNSNRPVFIVLKALSIYILSLCIECESLLN